MSLPTLRMIVRPEPGLGLDARLPMGKHVCCNLAMEAYFQGGSAIYFGLEPARFPFIQLQFAPRTRLNLRIPVVPLTEFKTIFAGGSLTLYDKGSRPQPVWKGWKPLWRSLEHFLSPMVEVQHRTTLLGSMLDSEQRKAIRTALQEANTRRQERLRERVRERSETVKGFDPPELPKLDPRQRADAIGRLRQKMRERYGDRSIVGEQATRNFREGMEKRLYTDDNLDMGEE